MRRLLGLTLLSLFAAPLAARADGSIQLTARGGVAKPLGETANGAKLADGVAWAFPLEAQLQFRVVKQLAIGAYGRYAPTTLASDLSNACSAANASCGVTDIGFGALAEYRFRERLEGGPWLGASFGWELLKSDAPTLLGPPTVPGLFYAKATSTLSGFEVGVSGGIDFELGGLTLGPYASVSAGQYSKLKVKSGGTSSTPSIADKAIHGWVGVGLRASLLF